MLLFLFNPLSPSRVKPIFFSFVNRTDGPNNSSWSSAAASPAVHEGRYYNFSRPPLFVFYVYSAFLVDDTPSRDVIRLVAITSPVERFIRNRTDVLCVVRYADGNLTHVASILQRVPRIITEPAAAERYKVADYVYNCPLPENQQQRRLVPVSTVTVFTAVDLSYAPLGKKSVVIAIIVHFSEAKAAVPGAPSKLGEWLND